MTFWLDVWNKQVIESEALKLNSDCRRLATAVQSELNDDDWHDLFFWFRLIKSEVIAETDLKQFDTKTLPDAAGGRMVGFVDVFPWGLTLEFALGDEFWAVDEQYCVQTGCTCHESILTFLKYRDRNAKAIVGPKNAPSLRYDYRSKTIEKAFAWPLKVPSPREMMEALEKSEPSLSTGMELRHTLLQALYAQRELTNATKLLSPFIRSLKVGRNDPCPCGSGKKFKHCCFGKGPVSNVSR